MDLHVSPILIPPPTSLPFIFISWEPIIQIEVSQKAKDQYSILPHIYGILKDGNDNPICKTEKETQMIPIF